jgi:hypothetical protein
MASSVTELRPPPTRPSPPPTRVRSRPSGGWYWVAGFVAILGLTAAFIRGRWGAITALDRVDDFDRVTIPGSMTVSVADPGTKIVYYENGAELARHADPTATSRPAIPDNPATDATIEVGYATDTPTWRQLGLQVTGPDGAVVPVRTYRHDRVPDPRGNLLRACRTRSGWSDPAARGPPMEPLPIAGKGPAALAPYQ